MTTAAQKDANSHLIYLPLVQIISTHTLQHMQLKYSTHTCTPAAPQLVSHSILATYKVLIKLRNAVD